MRSCDDDLVQDTDLDNYSRQNNDPQPSPSPQGHGDDRIPDFADRRASPSRSGLKPVRTTGARPRTGEPRG